MRAQRLVVGCLLGIVLLFGMLAPSHAYQRSLRFERMSIDKGLALQSVLTIVQDRQGFMWFGTQAGLNRFDGYQVRLYRNDPNDPHSIPDNYILSSHLDAAGRLWFGTKRGLALFDPETGGFTRYLLDEAGQGMPRQVTAIASDRDGSLWLGSNSGLLQFDPKTGRHRVFHHDPANPASLRDGPVNALAIDHRGALWIGLATGLSRLVPGLAGFEHVDVAAPGDLEGNQVRALSMGPHATLWVGTARGLQAWDLARADLPRLLPGLAGGAQDEPVQALYHDNGENLWVGTAYGGLKWRNPADGRFLTYRHLPQDHHSLSDNRVQGILIDRSGTLWVATYYGGVNRTDLASGGFSRFGDSEGDGAYKVRAIADAPEAKLWIGTTTGLLHYDPQTDAVSPQALPLSGPERGDGAVTALLQHGARLWIGTATGLLWRDPDGTFGRVPMDELPALARHIHLLRAGRDGTLWAATRGGLLSIARDGRVLRRWHHQPGDVHSLGSDYCQTVLEDRNGVVWVGTEAGLERMNPDRKSFTRYRNHPADSSTLRHSRVYALLESRSGDLWVGTGGGLHRMEVKDGAVRFQFYPMGGAFDAPPIGGVIEDDDGIIWASTTVGVARIDPLGGKARHYTARDGLVDGNYFVGAALLDRQGWIHFGGISGMSSFQPSQVRDNPFAPKVAITDMRVLNRSRARYRSVPPSIVRLSHDEDVFALEFAALHYADPQGNRYAYRLQGFDPDWIEVDASRRFATYTNLDPGTYVFRVRAANKDGLWSEEAASMVIEILPPFWKTWWFQALAVLAVVALGTLLYRLRVRALVQQRAELAHQVAEHTAELRRQKEAAERGKLEVERQKESVERAHRDIALLSDMGRTVTANLEREAIMHTLYQHVRALMEVRWFAVARLRADGRTLDVPFVMVDGQRVEGFSQPLASNHLLAECVANGRDVLLEDVGEAPDESVLVASCTPGQGPRALLCVPVGVGGRRLGALMVQGDAPATYGRVHLDMLGTLASYVGVAIDNAEAYLRLQQTQAQLAARERMASLGSLVAGVAHELNTPIGNSLLMASTLQDKAKEAATRFQTARLTRSELATFLDASHDASSLMVRSLQQAAELVNSFRQVSFDQTSAQRRRFDLAQACQEIAATLMNKVRLAGHRLALDISGSISVDGYPGPLGQVIINFVDNAMLHAFEHGSGEMVLRARQHGNHVEIVFEDNGSGIAPEHIGRIFDPFYTTRLGQGGNGLGLNIVYNIVTSLLGGTIRVESTTGTGTRFIVDLPVVAPRQASRDVREPETV